MDIDTQIKAYRLVIWSQDISFDIFRWVTYSLLYYHYVKKFGIWEQILSFDRHKRNECFAWSESICFSSATYCSFLVTGNSVNNISLVTNSKVDIKTMCSLKLSFPLTSNPPGTRHGISSWDLETISRCHLQFTPLVPTNNQFSGNQLESPIIEAVNGPEYFSISFVRYKYFGYSSSSWRYLVRDLPRDRRRNT